MALPIRAGTEVMWYLTIPFEEDVHTLIPHIEGESSRGPGPTLCASTMYPVPPGDVLLHAQWGPFRSALWKRYGPTYISALMHRDVEGIHNEARSRAEWASALRPGSQACRTLTAEPDDWTKDSWLEVGLLPASAQDQADMVWENDMFLFRYDIEQLAACLHSAICNAPRRQTAAAWVRVRDSVRCIWGPGLTYFPDAQEPAFLDSEDDLIRLRHWRALARIMDRWDLPAHLAMGGTVRGIEEDLQEMAMREFGCKMHTFLHHRISAHTMM